MDRAANELAAVENAIAEAAEGQIKELNDLHLALVGGGFAEVVVG